MFLGGLGVRWRVRWLAIVLPFGPLLRGCISPSAVVLLSWSPIGHCGGKIMSDMYTNLNLESQRYQVSC